MLVNCPHCECEIEIEAEIDFECPICGNDIVWEEEGLPLFGSQNFEVKEAEKKDNFAEPEEEKDVKID